MPPLQSISAIIGAANLRQASMNIEWPAFLGSPVPPDLPQKHAKNKPRKFSAPTINPSDTDNDTIADSTQAPTVSRNIQERVTATENMFKRQGGRAGFEEVVAGLRASNLWTGDIDSYGNTMLWRKVLNFPVVNWRTNGRRREDYVGMEPVDIDYWARDGPMLTEPKYQKRNLVFAAKAEQFVYFAGSVLRDREDARSVTEYESVARLLGLRPWSGPLVERIVAVACDLQKQPYPSTKVPQEENQVVQVLESTLKRVRQSLYMLLSKSQSGLNATEGPLVQLDLESFTAASVNAIEVIPPYTSTLEVTGVGRLEANRPPGASCGDCRRRKKKCKHRGLESTGPSLSSPSPPPPQRSKQVRRRLNDQEQEERVTQGENTPASDTGPIDVRQAKRRKTNNTAE